MSKRISAVLVVILIAGGLSLMAADSKTGTWSGWVTDTDCGAKGASADHAACAKQCVTEKGAKYALYNATDKKVYILEPQGQAAPHAGQQVTVKGSVDGDTITATSIAAKGSKSKPDSSTKMDDKMRM